MLRLVLRALRARRAQTLTMFALATLAGLGSAAAPWFLVWGGEAVARADLAAAPPTQRLYVASGSLQYQLGAPSPIDFLRDELARLIPVPGTQTQVGARLLAAVRPQSEEASPAESESVASYLVYRDEACEHLDIVAGSCPTGQGDVIVSGSVARSSGLAVGDPVHITASGLTEDVTLRVSGVYEVSDPFDLYWLGAKLLAALGETSTRDPMFVSEPTMLGLPLTHMDVDAHVLLPDQAFTDRGRDLKATLGQASAELRRQRIQASSTAAGLLDRIEDDRRLVVLGVSVGAAQLVLICWVALFLAVRHTAAERRGDIGLLKLRGVKTRRVAALVAQQSGVPMLAGTALGAVLGFGMAAGLAYVGGGGALGIARSTLLGPLATLELSLAAAAVAGLGGLVAALWAEWRLIATPVVDLLRRVPARQRGWRAEVAELVLVLVAVAGIYEARVEARDGGETSALVLLTPALVGIAVALVLGRALLPLAARVGAWGLRAGRAGVALAALQLARRQGPNRVFTVLAVATAILTTATAGWHSATSAWRQRAELELGADRVLTVDAASADALLAAVRAVDPEGRYAMAVAGTLGVRVEDRVLAVDATRLARVGLVPDGLPSAAEMAALLRPAAPEPPVVVDGPVALDVALTRQPQDEAGDPGGDQAGGQSAEVPLAMQLHLSTMDGVPGQVNFTLEPGRHVVEGAVRGCPQGCRLVALQVTAPPGARLSTATTVEVYGLRQGADTVLSGEQLGDVARWRTSLIRPIIPPEVSPSGDRLAITVGQDAVVPTGVNSWVFPLTAPSPLPVLLAGAHPDRHGGDERITMLGGAAVPYRVARAVPLLPHLGEVGMMVDLEYALRSNDAPTGSVDLSVWLSADAPQTLIAALADHGVTVRGEESVAGRSDDFAGDGAGLALLFGYFAAGVVLLLAAGVAVVGSTVERAGRVAELVALRAQGLGAGAVRAAGIAGSAVLVGAATVTGAVAALLCQAVVTAGRPVFTDGWTLLPVPEGLTPTTLGISVGAAIVVLGTASLWGAARLVAAVGTRTGGREAAR